MVGQAVIYMVEIINKVQAISLNYGTITRDSPVRSEHVAFDYQVTMYPDWMQGISFNKAPNQLNHFNNPKITRFFNLYIFLPFGGTGSKF